MDFIYNYGLFDSFEVFHMKSEMNDSDDEYGHFVDIENVEPVEIIEFYLVKNMYNNGYNVCRKNIKNPNYMQNKVNDMIEIEDECYLINTKKYNHIFRYLLSRYTYITLSFTLLMVFLYNMNNDKD